jgi:hypothetical protein
MLHFIHNQIESPHSTQALLAIAIGFILSAFSSRETLSSRGFHPVPAAVSQAFLLFSKLKKNA